MGGVHTSETDLSSGGACGLRFTPVCKDQRPPPPHLECAGLHRCWSRGPWVQTAQCPGWGGEGCLIPVAPGRKSLASSER